MISSVGKNELVLMSRSENGILIAWKLELLFLPLKVSISNLKVKNLRVPAVSLKILYGIVTLVLFCI